MEGHKGGKEGDFQRKILSMKKRMPPGVKWIWKTNHLAVGHQLQYLHSTRKKMEKDKQFEIQRLKEHRKTVLGNLTKQINIISPLLADFESEKQVPTEVK